MSNSVSPTGDQPFVFVSYSHEDEALVLAEIEWLQQQGLDVWYDKGISVGSEWTEEIAEAIERCTVFIYFVTPASASSRHCRNEVQYALDRSKQLIVVHLQTTELPGGLGLSLNLTQALFAQEIPRTEFRQQLLTAITERKPDTRRRPTANHSQKNRSKKMSLSTGAMVLTILVIVLTTAAFLWPRQSDTRAGMSEYWAAKDYLRRWPNQNNIMAARENIETALTRNPDRGIYHAALCEIETTAWRRGYVDTLEIADSACRTAGTLEPDSWEVRVALAYLLLAEGKVSAANSEVNEALALSPEQPKIHETLGRIRGSLGDQSGAIAAFEKAIELEPEYWSHYEMLGSYLYAQGRYVEAVPPLEAAVDLAPRDAIPALNNLANAYLMSSQLDEAKAIYERTTEIRETSWSHDAIGRIEYLRGCPTHAASAFRLGLNVQPRWRIWGALGEACNSVQGGQRVARLALQKALEGANQLDSLPPQAEAEIAHYYALLGEKDLAEKTIENMESLDSVDESVTAYYLALAYRTLDRREAFEAALSTATALGYPVEQLPVWDQARQDSCPNPPINGPCNSVDGLPL